MTQFFELFIDISLFFIIINPSFAMSTVQYKVYAPIRSPNAMP